MHRLDRIRRGTGACLGLALALSASVLPWSLALAEDTNTTGSITITQRHNEGATYDAYLLFKADISADDHATHITWADDSLKNLVLGFLDDNGYQEWLASNHDGTSQHDRAQNACEYLSLMIAGSPTDTGAATTPRTTEGLSFANRLAQSLAHGSIASQTVSSGQTFTSDEGYYLFVTTDATTEAHSEAGTAPIWVPLGGSVTEILEKSAVPSLEKEVQEDSTGAWGKVADAHTSQDLKYRLTGTLPTNYGAFDQYHFQFTDTLEDGLSLALAEGQSLTDAIQVEVGGQSASIDGSNLIASYEGNVLTVEFKDLKSTHWASYEITKDTTIRVSYSCHMNDHRAIGVPGNLNGAYLTYTDDPISNGDGRTDEVDARVFAYMLSLVKVDEQTSEPLEGAGFTMRVADTNSDAASKGLWVQADGSLGPTEHEFTTAADGSFEVWGLDEGTYLISEVTAPEGWDAPDEDITLVVGSELEGASLALTGLTATIDTSDGNTANHARVDKIDGDAGHIVIQAPNDRWLTMPITGRDGIGFMAAAGSAAAIGASVILSVRRRRLF